MAWKGTTISVEQTIQPSQPMVRARETVVLSQRDINILRVREQTMRQTGKRLWIVNSVEKTKSMQTCGF